MDASWSDEWNEAVEEWEIIDCEEDLTLSSACICGKEKLRYLYTIRNRETEHILFPIGSSCIKKFERDDMIEETNIREKLFRLYHAIQENERIELNSRFFSRNLLGWLSDEGAFKATIYNNFDGRKDYLFMMDMFNKRKGNITDKQWSKIRAIIVTSIRPYLIENLKVRE